MTNFDDAVANCRMMQFDAVWSQNWQTTVQIQVRIGLKGNVEIEMSNIVGSMCDDDQTFEERAIMSRDQFKVFAAALKAFADTL